jgi:alpha-D-ribose 1-methylphosphonate 5-triphosphate diphosphatase PhnM
LTDFSFTTIFKNVSKRHAISWEMNVPLVRASWQLFSAGITAFFLPFFSEL